MTDNHTKAVAVIEQHPLPDTTHPVVRAMLAQSPDPATLRELLAVQQQWERDEARKAFTRALTELKRDLPTTIARDKTVQFGNTKYTHASLANMVEAVTPALTLHGFSLTFRPSTSGRDVTVTARLTHAAGHYEEVTISAPADDKGSKSAPQAVASTITLLQRYTAASMLGLATADMSEPTGEPPPPDPTSIDSARNLKAAAAIKKAGRDVPEAEAMIGRHVAEWTHDDLGKLRAWLKGAP